MAASDSVRCSSSVSEDASDLPVREGSIAAVQATWLKA